MTLRYFTFAGIRFGAINRDSGADRILELAAGTPAGYVCITGAHGVVYAQAHPEYLAVQQQAALVTPDGTPLSWFARLKGFTQVTRVTGWELVVDAIEKDRGRGALCHFFLGARAEVTDRIQRRLKEVDPGIRIAGVINPPFRPMTPDEFAAAIAAIIQGGANIVWVGISTPRQEYLARDVAAALPAGVAVACGAAFDYIAGTIGTPPRFVTSAGLEWLYRLLSEPRRLWRRYFDVVPKFMLLFAREMLRR